MTDARIVAPKTVNEGAGEFTFKIEWQDVSFLSTSYTVTTDGGSATADSDYSSFSSSGSMAVSQFPAGPYATDKFSIALTDDLKAEKAETINITVTATNTEFANGSDTFTFAVTILDNDTPTAGADKLYGNNGRNTIDGLAGDDTIFGYRGDDKLIGGAGNDKLYGGGGNDGLTGGAGKDNFVFNEKLASTNVDTIVDFFAKDDTITVDHKHFAGLKVGKLASSAFQDLTKGKADGNDRITYDKKGDLFFDQDGSGTKYAAIKFAHIDGHAALTAADFVVV